MEVAHAKDTKERLAWVERLHEAPLLAHRPHGASPGSVQPPVATSSTRPDGSSLRRSSLPLAAALLLSASAPARCGSIPCCASVVFLDIGRLVLGLVFGNSFVTILGQFPIGILGVMLLFSGIELAMASRDMGSKEESFVMLVYAGVSLTGSSAALGFITRIVLYLLLRLREVDYRGLLGRWGAGRRQPANKAGEDGAGDA